MSEVFWPKKIDIKDTLANTLWSLISGFIGAWIIVLLVFLIWNAIDLTWTFTAKSRLTNELNILVPFLISVITFIGVSITTFLTYLFLSTTNPEKYKRTSIHSGQIGFFTVLSYIFITPVYFLAGIIEPDSIMWVFIGHIAIMAFGINIILEILNNYRYVLIGLYWALVGLFISVIASAWIFVHFSNGNAKLIILILLLPFVNAIMTFSKEIFQSLYYSYFRATWYDQLGDIFYQIESEEKERLREEVESNI